MSSGTPFSQHTQASDRPVGQHTYRNYSPMPGRHGCLLAGSLVDTPAGPQPIECLRPGDQIWGFAHAQRVPARILKIYRAEAAPAGSRGYRIKDRVILSGQTSLCWRKHWAEAAETGLEPVGFEGPVFDLKTDTGNFYCQGVLIGHLDAEERCQHNTQCECLA